MIYFIDFAYGSLNKHKEELCGDKVDFYSDDEVFVVVMADGLGSGVKANILATLTSKIGTTMLKEKMKIEDVIDTISKTLPISEKLNTAYSTFTLIRVEKDGMAYIAEFDNPPLIYSRNQEIRELEWNVKVVNEKLIRETRVQLRHGDRIVVISDGYKFAGNTEEDKHSWTYENTVSYIRKCCCKNLNAKETTNNLLELFNQLYYDEPIDDTTVLTLNVIRDKRVVLFSGAPVDPNRDSEIVNKFMRSRGKKIICGGTTSEIVARELKLKLKSGNIIDKDIPPLSYLEGIDLVTEGVITLKKSVEILEKLLSTRDYNFIHKNDAASKIAKMLYEEAVHIKIMAGKSVNQANQLLEMSNEVSNKIELLNELKDVLIKLGKIVEIEYF